MPYGAPVEGVDVFPAGPEENRVPFNQQNFVNTLNQTTNPEESPGFTLTNVTLANDTVSTSPVGIPQTTRVTTTVAGGTISQSTTVGANKVSTASVYLQIGSGTNVARFTHTRSGGAMPITASVDIDVATGIEIARVEPDFTVVDVQDFTIQGTSWRRINIQIDDQNGNATGLWSFSSGVNAPVGAVARIQGMQLAASLGANDILPEDFLRPPYVSRPPTNSTSGITPQPGTLPRYNVDSRNYQWVGQTAGGFTWTAKFPEWHNTVLLWPQGGTGTIVLPAALINPDFPLQNGFFFYIDTQESVNAAVPTINIRSPGANLVFVGGSIINGANTVNLLANFGAPNFSRHPVNNAQRWKLTFSSFAGSSAWIISPEQETHGALRFDASDTFCWPVGARVIYITAAAGGGGGASDGGGGGSGQAVHKLAVTSPIGAWGANFAVVIGAGGAGGAGGAAGAAGAATTISGGILTLAGGAGGNPSGLGGNGGAAGGAGGMNGQSAIRDLAVNMLLGGAGGGNIAGGVGGLPITSPIVSATATGSPGLQGGGGAGAGTAAGNGGNGGNGYVLIEW